MCIRDSHKYYNRHFCHTDSYESHALAYTRQVQYAAVCCYERNLMEGAETVSYTHLDVYKRQCQRTGIA